MKRLLFFLLLPYLLCSQTVTRTFSGTTAARQADVVNISTSNPVTSWSLTFYLGTGLTAGTFQLDCAPDVSGAAGTYAACTGAVDGTTNPVTVSASPLANKIELNIYTPHIAVNPTSLTGSGTWTAVLTGRFGAPNLPTTVSTSGGGGGGSTTQGVCTTVATVTLSGTGFNTVVAASGSTKITLCNIAYASASSGNPTINTFTLAHGASCAGSPTNWIVLPGITGYTDQFDGTFISAAGDAICAKEGTANSDVITLSYLQQ